MRTERKSVRGFSLIELIMVIVLTGILSSMVAIFIRAPVQGYFDSARRAEMTDIADTALRRLGRDIRTAVPNSVRPAGTGTYIEFLPTKAGGRYRAAPATISTGACGSAQNAVLDFGVADNCFEILGPQVNFTAGDQIVIGSTQSDGNPPYSYSTTTGILRAHNNVMLGSRPTVDFTNAGLPEWAALSSQRFSVVDGAQQAVTYACVGTQGALDANNDGQVSLIRYWSYGYRTPQLAPAAIAALPPTQAILADKISNCSISYSAFNQRFGIVAIQLEITRGGEPIRLYHEIHVNNLP